MEKRQILYNRVILILLIFCIALITVMSGRVSFPARAESESVRERYEQTNVADNLKGATIGGKQFSFADYPHNANGKPQVISFVEFAYSYYEEKQDDFGLYVYVYNPQDAVIDTNTERNKIQLTYGNKPGYDKYILDFLNYSKEPGYEGRFFKFKIRLTGTQIYNILNTVSPDERVYKISGIELSVKSRVTEYTVASTYKYKGYALGYGSDFADSDTLTCTVDGFDKYLTLDVKSTYWRPDGTHEDKITRDTLHSVYFGVPNEIIEEYGEMTAVHATWLNAYTSPMFITGNRTVYNAASKIVGQEFHGGDVYGTVNNGFGYALLAMRSYSGNQSALETNKYSLYTSFNTFERDSHSSRNNPPHHNLYGQINELDYVFYAENGDADTYDLPAEQIVGDPSKGIDGWLKTFTDKYGTKDINNRYSSKLFSQVDTGFTDITIRNTDTFDLQDVVFSNNFWEILFGGYIQGTNSYKMQAIQKVTLSDIQAESNHATFCDKYYIADSDYDEFTNYVTEASAKNETVYLFRYKQTEYKSMEVTTAKRTYAEYGFFKDLFNRCMFHYNSNFGENDCTWDHGWYEYVDCNGFFAQMWIQLDFDIIDLTFTKDGVATIIPVVMSPIDIAADAEHPVFTSPEIPEKLKWWQILLAVLLGVLVIFLLLKFAPGLLTVIAKVVIFIISLPFKLIGALFKPIHKAAQKSREKRKVEREAEKERKRIEKEEKAAAEKERKEAEKRQKAKEKQEQKEREKQEREAERKKKAEQRDIARLRHKAERKERKQRYTQAKKKLSLADLDRMSDSELAELYFETYGFDDSDIPDELFD